MSDVIKLRSLTEIDEEAATWVWRMDSDEVAVEVRKTFEEWLRRDVRHRRAFEELGGVWTALDGLAEAKRDEKIATLIADHQRTTIGTLPPPPGSRWGLRLLPWAAAATLLIAIGAFAWLQRGNESQTLATAVGQHRAVSLADGSKVFLNTNTILETRFIRERRTIRLVKGEASFKVARDAQRPFLVYAGTAVIRAVGTEFNVRLGSTTDVQVIVAEGRVAVSSPLPAEQRGRGEAAPVILAAGERLNATARAAPIVALRPEALANSLAWREGAIIFDGQPLAEAIAELNRYTDIRFIVTDPKIRELVIGGRFKAGDVDGFLQALHKALPVATRRTTDNIVYIEPKLH